MVVPAPAAYRALPTCHSLAIFLLLSEMTAEAFTGVTGGSGPTGNRHQKHCELKHECSSAVVEMGRDRGRRALLPLDATPQHKQQDDGVWWDGDVDPWTEAASRVRDAVFMTCFFTGGVHVYAEGHVRACVVQDYSLRFLDYRKKHDTCL